PTARDARENGMNGSVRVEQPHPFPGVGEPIAAERREPQEWHTGSRRHVASEPALEVLAHQERVLARLQHALWERHAARSVLEHEAERAACDASGVDELDPLLLRLRPEWIRQHLGEHPARAR